ncbi:hypothetical protein MCOR20_001258 [Pyricularia oryzae]|nr:hypothetical protein MCOR20_001258 [Pyricularia oryzae]KAI6472311.1 hypothetical protein MCOR15_000495 [Pyricularia oryzae]KAI6534881.1 hypothetical protein MCOR16_002977 [Pyricularia oryzae]KAI6577035.1 hypothetical protein MCOR09_000746 [Pyricularia oryzae]
MMKFLAFASLATCVASVAGSGSAADGARAEKREVSGSYIPTKAPYDNLWLKVTDEEERDIISFIDRERNVSIPLGFNFVRSSIWLLAPNKTEASLYLSGQGQKPKRYARIMGGGDCVAREYMIGPLPVSNATRATALDYMYRGNATLVSNSQWCTGSSSNSKLRRDAAEEARASREKRTLERREPSNPYNEKMGWNGDELPHDDQSPPVAILPNGARHEFDPEQNYVSWMDFTFYVATGRAGLSVHDIRYKGERVVYELAMQEALSHYAGPDRAQTYASYIDVTIGFTGFNLIPGFDCPSYATYTDAFCLFEFPKDFPMNRHYNRQYRTYDATSNTAFMLRSVSTVDNYDYMTTYEFRHDGSIEVIVRASGYIQGSRAVNEENAWDYGFKIREDLSGSMHDHVLNFKADLDIYGTNNSLFKTQFVPHQEVYPWSNGAVVNTMKAERSFITNEDQGKINWAPNAAASYSVVNRDKPNEFGEYPGYKIYPSTGSSIHVTVQNSTVFPREINWATHHLYALRRKDSEPVSAHPITAWDKAKPPFVDFDDFFDGESLEQEDLVVYFNLGMHHMPDTYDLPVTVFQGAQSGMTLRPQNYQRSDGSLSTRQQIYFDTREVKKYGREDLEGSYDLAKANPPFYPGLGS